MIFHLRDAKGIFNDGYIRQPLFHYIGRRAEEEFGYGITLIATDLANATFN
jgi:hypothetical protein